MDFCEQALPDVCRSDSGTTELELLAEEAQAASDFQCGQSLEIEPLKEFIYEDSEAPLGVVHGQLESEALAEAFMDQFPGIYGSQSATRVTSVVALRSSRNGEVADRTM